MPIPDAMPFEAAALSEPLAVCLHAVNRGNVAGKSVAIIGAGPIGLLTLLARKAARAPRETTMVDIAAAPLAFATRLGADRVVDLSADPDGLGEDPGARRGDRGVGQPRRARRRHHAPSAAAAPSCSSASLPGGNIPAPINPVMAKELDLVGSFRFDTEFEEAVGLIAAGAIDVLAIVTATRPLADVNDAFALALDRSQSVKVVLTGLTAHDSTRGRDIAATDRPDPWPWGRETLLYPFARH